MNDKLPEIKADEMVDICTNIATDKAIGWDLLPDKIFKLKKSELKILD